MVIFSCGNAADELRRRLRTSFYVVHKFVEIGPGPNADLNSVLWWSPAQIHASWPNLFDATSGHLPFALMVEIAQLLRVYVSGAVQEDKTYYVPTGSGETIFCLKMAFPKKEFVAVYDNSNPATVRNSESPLTAVVERMFPVLNIGV